MADPIAESLLEYRKHFPALEDCVHFISHSLGCVPAQAKDDLGEFFELWRTKSITAWGDWLPEVDRSAERISKIISAPAGTVIMQHNVSQIMATLIRPLLVVASSVHDPHDGQCMPVVSSRLTSRRRTGSRARHQR